MKNEVRVLDNGLRSAEEQFNYAIKQSKINLFWNQGLDGEGIKVGVVDTGIDYDHEMLRDKVIIGKNFSSDGKPSDDIYDYNYHGTAVSSLISGEYINSKVYGIAPKSKIIVAKSMNQNGKGSLTSIANGINYCVEQGADIINCSVGAEGTSAELENAVMNAFKHGVSIICASGNLAVNDSEGNVRELMYPGGYAESIVVGAMDVNYRVGDFSNSNEYVDFVAQGVDILCAYPKNQYAVISGTSFACPIISGIFALLKQKFKIDFGRNPTESELFGMAMKYTRELEGKNKQAVGNGYIDLSIRRRRRL